jgi:hypothetical protein
MRVVRRDIPQGLQYRRERQFSNALFIVFGALQLIGIVPGMPDHEIILPDVAHPQPLELSGAKARDHSGQIGGPGPLIIPFQLENRGRGFNREYQPFTRLDGKGNDAPGNVLADFPFAEGPAQRGQPCLDNVIFPGIAEGKRGQVVYKAVNVLRG